MKRASKRVEFSLQTMRLQPSNERVSFLGRNLLCHQQLEAATTNKTKRKQRIDKLKTTNQRQRKQTNESNDKTATRSPCGRDHKDTEQLAAPLSAETPRNGHARRQANTPTQHRGMDYTAFLHRHRSAEHLNYPSRLSAMPHHGGVTAPSKTPPNFP